MSSSNSFFRFFTSTRDLSGRILTLMEDVRLSRARRREVEALQREAKEFDRLKSDFFAILSNELLTPLAQILGPTRKLLAPGAIDDHHRADLIMIERNARSLLKHTNDLLDISKLEAGDMELELAQADLAAVARIALSHFESLAADRGITLGVQVPSRLPARLDVGKIERVFANLFSNAFKFTPDGGTVFCGIEDEGDVAIISIRDSGPGIAPEQREVVFDHFRMAQNRGSRQLGGSGLGLAIAREFVRLHEGTLAISDAPEGGADIRIVLPLRSPGGRTTEDLDAPSRADTARQAAADLAHPPEEIPVWKMDGAVNGTTESPLVLVAESDREMNDFICRTLSARYRVATAFTGEEAYGIALGALPDMIICDVTLPRVNGEHLVRMIRRHHELDTTPVVLVTDHANDDMIAMLRSEIQDYLIQPFAAAALLTRVGNLVTMKKVREALHDGQGDGNVDVATIATEVTRNRQALQSALEAKDRFLVVLAHELRAPLTPVLTATQFLAEDPAMNHESRRLLDVIDRNVRTEARLIDDLLDLTKLASGGVVLDIRSVDLHDALRHAIETYREEIEAKDLALDVELTAQSPLVRADAARLLQIFRNIVKNAAKFTPAGGRITVCTRNDHQGRVIVEITDTGIGIEHEMLGRVFDAFEQGELEARRFGGLGLGLSISRMLVELHGGTIRASSRGRHRGATITVVLPRRIDN